MVSHLVDTIHYVYTVHVTKSFHPMAIRTDTETGIRKYRNRRPTDTGHYMDTGSLREHTERFTPSGTNLTLSVKTTRTGVFWL